MKSRLAFVHASAQKIKLSTFELSDGLGGRIKTRKFSKWQEKF